MDLNLRVIAVLDRDIETARSHPVFCLAISLKRGFWTWDWSATAVLDRDIETACSHPAFGLSMLLTRASRFAALVDRDFETARSHLAFCISCTLLCRAAGIGIAVVNRDAQSACICTALRIFCFL